MAHPTIKLETQIGGLIRWGMANLHISFPRFTFGISEMISELTNEVPEVATIA